MRGLHGRSRWRVHIGLSTREHFPRILRPLRLVNSLGFRFSKIKSLTAHSPPPAIVQSSVNSEGTSHLMHGTDSEDVALDLSEEEIAYEYFNEAWARPEQIPQ